MKVRRFADARAFLERAGPWLLAAEAENGLLLGIVTQLMADHPYEQPIFLATVEDADEVVGCAFRTPPYQAGLTRLPLEAVAAVAESLAELYDQLPGVNGPAAEASRLADLWTRGRGQGWSIRHRIGLHVLTKVVPPTDPPAGELRQAREDEVDLANEWAAGFVRDTGIPNERGEFGERLLRQDALFFWDDGEPRSMVGATRFTPHGAGISAVYTPPALRGRGYASSAVAALSKRLLDAGWEFCFLYTDLANPTSNAIYAQIGYVPVCDSIDIAFQ